MHTTPPAPSSPASPDEARGRKSTLFCPDCGHASPVDGDWRVRMVADHRRVRCPECHAVVDDRRTADGPSADAEERDASPVRRCVDAWDRCWSAWRALMTGTPSAETDC